jgi:hypothetical protein
MLCLLTARHLKPDSYETFAESWKPEKWHGRLVRAYHVRSQDDPGEVITFAFFDGTVEDIEEMRDDPEWMAGEERRLRRIAPLEDAVRMSGVYEVVDEIVPH